MELGHDLSTTIMMICGFLSGIAIQWAWDKSFGAIIREYEHVAENVSIEAERFREDEQMDWTKEFYKKKMIQWYSEKMGELTERMRNKQIVLGDESAIDELPPAA